MHTNGSLTVAEQVLMYVLSTLIVLVLLTALLPWIIGNERDVLTGGPPTFGDPVKTRAIFESFQFVIAWNMRLYGAAKMAPPELASFLDDPSACSANAFHVQAAFSVKCVALATFLYLARCLVVICGLLRANLLVPMHIRGARPATSPPPNLASPGAQPRS
jgi:hypothetical protein